MVSRYLFKNKYVIRLEGSVLVRRQLASSCKDKEGSSDKRKNGAYQQRLLTFNLV